MEGMIECPENAHTHLHTAGKFQSGLSW